jgi:hypothetical protein
VFVGNEASTARRTTLGRHLVPLIVGFGIFCIAASAEAGVEARCTELGANCIASEPLNTDTYVQDVAAFWDPADTDPKDTTSKQMSLDDQFPGACIEETGFDTKHVVDTSGPMFSALPNISPSIKFLLRTTTSGGNFLGHVFPASAPTARVAFRWYVYFSSDFEFTDSTCLNSGKLFEMGDAAIPLVWTGGTRHQMYGWAGWSPTSLDCCLFGPGPSGGNIPYDAATMNGKWWRFEIAVRNNLPTASQTIIQTWRKNVTDNLAEQLVLDTSMATPQGAVGDQWTSAQASTLKPLKTMARFAVTVWRNGVCAGYHGVTHMLAAAWDTDAGQRIGAATEIEGSTVPAPKNLNVLPLFPIP